MNDKPPSLRFSKQSLELSTEKAFDYLDMASSLALKGMKIVSFGIGQPDFPTPTHVVEAAIRALKEGFTRYVSPPGILELRSAIADHVSKFTRAGDVKPEETIVLPGAKACLFIAIASYVENGDEVVIPDPGFPAYESIVRYSGGIPVFYELKWDEDFRMTLEGVQNLITNKTKMIILNFPHNPTGAMCSPSEIKGVLETAKERGILVLSDEIYDHYVYGEVEFQSVLSDENWRDFIIYVNGFSKTWSMTGWRLGYIVAKEEAIKRFTLFAINNFSCTCAFVQKAGVAALNGPMDFFNEILDDYKRRRDLSYKLLNEVPEVRVKKAPGAFYLFPCVKEVLKKIGMTTEEFAIRMMNLKGVVMIPGFPGFPAKAGDGYLRYSYSVPMNVIEEGLRLFHEGVEEITN